METIIVSGFMINGNELIRSIAQLYLVTVFREFEVYSSAYISSGFSRETPIL